MNSYEQFERLSFLILEWTEKGLLTDEQWAVIFRAGGRSFNHFGDIDPASEDFSHLKDIQYRNDITYCLAELDAINPKLGQLMRTEISWPQNNHLRG